MHPDDPLIGRQLANFKIERAIGRGGMAQVYYGQDVKLQRPVAIKVIDARYRSNPSYARRFVREAQAVAQWRHEHIIQIYYADDEDGLYYFAMEYIDGSDLGELLAHYAARNELMPTAEVGRIGRAVASALDYAHQRHVIHRDVKPSNVMAARDGRIVLADFGLAMDAEQGSMGEVFGSAHYIAPEQARRSADAVPQSDLYSLGVILYEMLTGRVPFDDPSSTAVAIQHLTMPPPPPRTLNPDLSEAVENVLLKALNKVPQERYQSGREMLEALTEALQVDPASVSRGLFPSTGLNPPGKGQPVVVSTSGPSPARSRLPLAYIGVGLGLLAVICLVLVGLSAAFYFWPPAGVPGEQQAAAQTLSSSDEQDMAAQPTTEATSTEAGPTIEPTVNAQESSEENGQTVTPATPGPTETPIPTPVEPESGEGGPGESTPTETPILTPAEPESEEGGPGESTPTETPIPTPVEPAVTETATATPIILVNYSLLIARKGEESLFVVNQGDVSFPLFQLQLGNDIGMIDGAAWDVALLENGACVSAWKEPGNGKGKEKEKEKGELRPPDAAAGCSLVGEPLFFEKKDNFWKEDFVVFYNEDGVEMCSKDNEQCLVNINNIPLR
jgi:serine/threonine protein kinase